ncbi:MAG: hypothetical protein IPK60_03970 [Sandaracinaceae bacterium]|nr:hypothetical protein [Sandaracinaceae bacterium]
MRVLLVCALLLVAGCPRDNAIPDPPSDARACTSVADCNDGRVCGLLAACAAGFCEETQSLDLPCPAPLTR